MTEPRTTVISEDRTASTEMLPPVRAEVEIRVSPENAFRAFATDFDRWWPREHRIGTTDLAEAIIEPHVGGRFYERSVDGSECDWGQVLEWDPPRRLVLSWGIQGDWQYRPGLEHASRVEVTFTALPDGRTRVVLEHGEFERHGATGAQVRTSVSSDGGWPWLIRRFATLAESSASA
jgi:uncharacterized protein YndB with AHSA1/START domain